MASTVNMYEGAEIYGNKMTNYLGIVHADTFNMYGGKIYGNYVGCYGLVQASTANVYGGEITDNYVTGVVNNGVPSALFTSKAGSTYGKFIIYDCQIKNNLLLTANPDGQSLLCASGGSCIVSGTYTENYETADWGTEPTKVGNVYTSSYDVSGASESTIRGNYTVSAYSVIFKNTDSSVINAYMLKSDGTVIKSVDGSEAVAIPTGITSWSAKANDCKAVEVVLNSQGTYYVSAEHTVTGEKDCTKGVICDKCKTTLTEPQASHNLVITIVYENNNFVKAGTRTEICQNSACEHNEITEAPALFIFVGYSTNNDNTELCASYTTNVKAMEEYTTYNKDIKLQYGVIATANPTTLDILSVENGSVVTNIDKAILAPIAGNYAGFDFRLTGFTNVTSKDELDIKAVSLVINAYVAVNEEIYYIGSYSDLLSYNTEAEAFTFYNISKEVPPTFE